jgi:dTMP kinase
VSAEDRDPAGGDRPVGRLVAFEGGEGCGKSTQAALLAERLGAVLTREPGGTALGARLRSLLLDRPAHDHTPVDRRAEALLMAADRAQHVAEVIRPALERGTDVVTDRYAGSSLAYQGFGRGLPVTEVRWLSEWATGGLWPDVVILLEVPPDTAGARMDGPPDRMEAAGRDFHDRVVAGFHQLAATDRRWVVIDGAGTIDEVAGRVWSAVIERLPRAPVQP